MESRPGILVTGFAPFQRFSINPSWSSARALAERFPRHIAARLLPVDHLAARTQLAVALEELRPDACLCMGLAPSDVFHLEERARKPAEFAGLPGPGELAATWEWGEMESHLQRRGVPHVRSTDAGQYVCESTFYSLLQFAAERAFPARAGFLHVPAISDCFTEQAIVEVVCDVFGGMLGP